MYVQGKGERCLSGLGLSFVVHPRREEDGGLSEDVEAFFRFHYTFLLKPLSTLVKRCLTFLFVCYLSHLRLCRLLPLCTQPLRDLSRRVAFQATQGCGHRTPRPAPPSPGTRPADPLHGDSHVTQAGLSSCPFSLSILCLMIVYVAKREHQLVTAGV